jgi:hypothetical protein
LGIEHLSLYVQLKRPIMEKTLAVRIKDWHEQDDTIGHHKLAVLLVLSSTASPGALRQYVS